MKNYLSLTLETLILQDNFIYNIILIILYTFESVKICLKSDCKIDFTIVS